MELPFQILLYYLYRHLPAPEAYLQEHRRLCEDLGLHGRIILGAEGINGTVSGSTPATQRYMETLQTDPRTAGIEFKIDSAASHCFPKLSLKLRPEIVTLGLREDDVDPAEGTGRKLSPLAWKQALHEEGVILLDGRNNYESALGHFQNAICPDVENFRDFPQWIRHNLSHLKDRQILTYCTGGIRCEKLSAFLLREGFQDVAQLDGGIVSYAKNPETRGEGFEGLCYVFDQRIAVEANFTPGRRLVSRCEKCSTASPRYRNCARPSCNRQFFLCESCETATNRFCSAVCEAKLSPGVSTG